MRQMQICESCSCLSRCHQNCLTDDLWVRNCIFSVQNLWDDVQFCCYVSWNKVIETCESNRRFVVECSYKYFDDFVRRFRVEWKRKTTLVFAISNLQKLEDSLLRFTSNVYSAPSCKEFFWSERDFFSFDMISFRVETGYRKQNPWNKIEARRYLVIQVYLRKPGDSNCLDFSRVS